MDEGKAGISCPGFFIVTAPATDPATKIRRRLHDADRRTDTDRCIYRRIYCPGTFTNQLNPHQLK